MSRKVVHHVKSQDLILSMALKCDIILFMSNLGKKMNMIKLVFALLFCFVLQNSCESLFSYLGTTSVIFLLFQPKSITYPLVELLGLELLSALPIGPPQLLVFLDLIRNPCDGHF